MVSWRKRGIRDLEKHANLLQKLQLMKFFHAHKTFLFSKSLVYSDFYIFFLNIY